jgi:hypothetical protein
MLVRGRDVPVCPACASQELDKLISEFAAKTEGTRQLGLRAAKKRDAKQADEQNRTQREYELHHND